MSKETENQQYQNQEDQTQQEPVIHLSFQLNAVRAILAGLGKLPLELVKDLYDGIVKDTEEQLKDQQPK